jgi:hypothetical protein
MADAEPTAKTTAAKTNADGDLRLVVRGRDAGRRLCVSICRDEVNFVN